MHDKNELYEKIITVFPDINALDIEIEVNYDKNNEAWIIDLKKGHHHLKTFLESDQAQLCINGKKSVPLGLQIAQFRKKIVPTN